MDPTTPTTPKTRTITLTNRPPVKIREAEWPVIATGSANDDDSSQPGNSPNRKWTRTIRVRQHTDGRAIIYGVYDYETAFQGENDAAAKRGSLLGSPATPDQIIAAIRAVGAELADAEDAMVIDRDPKNASRWREVVQECIADLPAEEI